MSEGATLERAPRRAAPAADLPPTLRRNAPLVPTDTSAGRALAAVIAILTFLAALCAGAPRSSPRAPRSGRARWPRR